MRNSRTTHRQRWITAYRAASTTLLLALVVIGGMLLARPAPIAAPTAEEIAEAVNGPDVFNRPSAMEYVAKTDSCVVGGVVMTTTWHVGPDAVEVTSVDSKTVDYTVIEFRSDQGRAFRVSANGALWSAPGQNLGLEVYCDQATMNTDPSFGLVRIIYGGA